MFDLGEAVVIAVPELVLPEPHALFPTADAAELTALTQILGPESYDDGEFQSCIRSWIVRMPGLVAVIDTGAGNGKPRPASPRFDRLQTPFLDRMAAAGVRPEDVDLVICTHLHVDHVGWNTVAADGGWRPTFPRARHVLPRVEVERWRNDPAAPEPFKDSVAPLLDHPGTLLAEGTETVAPGLRLVPLPGHSAGMMGVALGTQALFVADALHNLLQVWRPGWSSRYCADPAQAAATRLRLFEDAAAGNTLLLAAHVGGSGGFRVLRRGAGFDHRLEPGG